MWPVLKHGNVCKHSAKQGATSRWFTRLVSKIYKAGQHTAYTKAGQPMPRYLLPVDVSQYLHNCYDT